MKQICILCGRDLDLEPTNLEHYVPQVLIRNFDVLGIPRQYTKAHRINQVRVSYPPASPYLSYYHNAEEIIAPIREHKKWACVRTHKQCNTDAAGMCQDFKKIINKISNKPNYREDLTHHPVSKRILDYYARIWGVDRAGMRFVIYDKQHAIQRMTHTKVLYSPWSLRCGRFDIYHHAALIHPYYEEHRHTIYLRK